MDENKKVENKSEAIEWIKSIAIAIVIALFIRTFIFNTTYVLGNSMYPTLNEKDRLFANKVSTHFSSPTNGDIVIIEAPDSPKKDYIKRVIGIEGDNVEIKSGEVYLNGKLLEEDYIEKDSYTHVDGQNQWKIQEGKIFVLGDNRKLGASKDSRYFGTVSEDSVKGITEFRYFPFDKRFGKINKKK